MTREEAESLIARFKLGDFPAAVKVLRAAYRSKKREDVNQLFFAMHDLQGQIACLSDLAGLILIDIAPSKEADLDYVNERIQELFEGMQQRYGV